MSLYDINGILNQFGLSMLVVNDNVYFLDLNTNTNVPAFYGSNESKKVKHLLTGDNIYIECNGYKYTLNILLEDNKFYLHNLSKTTNNSLFKIALAISKDYSVNNAYSIYYQKDYAKPNCEKIELNVNSNSTRAVIEYYEENNKHTDASFYASFINNSNQASIAKPSDPYTTLLSFDDIINRNSEIANILGIVAPEVYSKCIMIDELKVRKNK